MTRNSRDSGEAEAEEPVEKLLEVVVADAMRARSIPDEKWWASNPSPLVPRVIRASGDREYRVTEEGLRAAHRLTEQEWWAREEFRQTIARESFDRLSFGAIGRTIESATAHLSPESGDGEDGGMTEASFYHELAKDYNRALVALADEARVDADRHIPCTLFREDQDVPAFAVGPVQFRPRSEWIGRFAPEVAERDAAQQASGGEISAEPVRDRAAHKERSQAAQNAWVVKTSLRGFSWVATIRAIGHEHKQAHRKMSMIAELAIDVVGLRFLAEDARRFSLAGRGYVHAEHGLATTLDGGLIHGSSLNLPGLASKPGALADTMKAEGGFLEAAGRILQVYVDCRQKGRAPHLVERWVNGLFWFGEARREGSDFMAVVKYGCAADVLSGAGGRPQGIVAFAMAAFEPRNEAEGAEPDVADQIKDAVWKVYERGRSGLAHGGIPGVLEDLTKERKVGDFLLVNLFDAVTFELAEIVEKRECVLKVPEKHAYRFLRLRLRARALQTLDTGNVGGT